MSFSQFLDPSFVAVCRPNLGTILQSFRRTAGGYEFSEAIWADQAYTNPSWLVSIPSTKVTGLGSAANHPATDFDAAGAAAAALTTALAADPTAAQLVPSQTGNAGKYLFTDGTVTSWAAVAGGGGGVALGDSPTWTGQHTWAPTAGGAVAAKFRASTTAPGNITEWQDAAGVPITVVNSAGRMGVGTSGPRSYLDVQIGTPPSAGDVPGTAVISGPAGGLYQGTLSLESNTPVGAGLGGTLVFKGLYSGNSPAAFAMIAGLKDNNTPGDFGGYLGFYTRPSGGNMTEKLRVTSAGSVQITGFSPSAVGVVIKSAASQTASLQEWQDSTGAVHATISENGYTTTQKNVAPADAELVAGEAAYWFDSTNGSAKFMIKAKQANGTVVTGSIPLT